MIPWTPRQVERLSKIEGWFDLRILPFYGIINEIQCEIAVGYLAEIGVHHGRSFLPLALMARRDKDESAVAIDVFGPNENLSGQGDEAILRAAALDLRVDDRVVVRTGDSRRMTRDDILGTLPYRFFSVDGDHSVFGTIHDLILAGDCLDPRVGVLVIDDLWNAAWPSVQEGFSRWALMGYPFFGVAHVYGRTILATNRDFAWRLRDAFLSDKGLPRPTRQSPWYGGTLLSYV